MFDPAGATIEPNYPALYDLNLDCAFEVIGPINDVTWLSLTADLSTNPPAAWSTAADSDRIVEVEVLLETDPARLSLTANDHTERYEPATGATSSCP